VIAGQREDEVDDRAEWLYRPQCQSYPPDRAPREAGGQAKRHSSSLRAVRTQTHHHER
jgi:hypothetical protein